MILSLSKVLKVILDKNKYSYQALIYVSADGALALSPQFLGAPGLCNL